MKCILLLPKFILLFCGLVKKYFVGGEVESIAIFQQHV